MLTSHAIWPNPSRSSEPVTVITADQAIAALCRHIQPGKATQMAAYHKAPRRYLGVANPEINTLTRSWRQMLPPGDRITLAHGLWQSDIHEARVAAAKLLTQARIRPDDAVWELICGWVPDFDGWAIADHAAAAGARRITADPARLDLVETWTTSPHLWTRRAALVMTLPFTKQNHPNPIELAARERILTWAATYTEDREWFIQKSVGWWLRDLSKHDPERVRSFLDKHGEKLRSFTRKEAAKYL